MTGKYGKKVGYLLAKTVNKRERGGRWRIKSKRERERIKTERRKEHIKGERWIKIYKKKERRDRE